MSTRVAALRLRSAVWALLLVPVGQVEPDDSPVVVPRLWDPQELAAASTPRAGLGVPPTYLSADAWYALPVDNLRTWPVYHPAREPPDYREELRRRGPQPLIEPGTLRSRADWVQAGRRVFEELDTPACRTADPMVLAHFTSAEAVDAWRDESHDVVDKDGVLLDYRWVVDQDGTLKLSLSSCSGCHSRLMPDGSELPGAPSNFDLSDAPAVAVMLSQLAFEGGDGPASFFSQFGVPWLPDDPHARLRDSPQELERLLSSSGGEPPGTMFARFNGSPLAKTRMADLRGIADRRWLDATGTFRNRGPEDVARYGLVVEYAPDAVFGPHHMLPPGRETVGVRPPDEALYALGLYLWSLEPPPSPHPFDDAARRGQEIFAAEGCDACHAPPAYTNNTLVAAPGFEPSAEDRARFDVSSRRVGTDPGLALRTRKGTGYYKVPSLRGLWYRGLYGHCGDVSSLEDWFDARRLEADYVPTGWRGPGVTARAVPGHEFGLDLPPEDRADLIAFLRTL